MHPIDAQHKPAMECAYLVHSEHVRLSHIEGGGIGYSQGYTSLAALFALDEGPIIPFFDLRGHVFDDGLFAANVGLALRVLEPTSVYGAYVFYDYRQTTPVHTNQVCLGAERLGAQVDVRLNGYLPFGRTGNALKVLNGEVGMHWYEQAPITVYGAVGPYYLHGKDRTGWGGALRVASTFYTYLCLEASTSYDSLFHWVAQVKLSLFALFGLRKITGKEAIVLKKRMVQEIDRFEIIMRHR